MRDPGFPFEDSEFGWRRLDDLWYVVKQAWRDGTRTQFERRYWLPLEELMEKRYLPTFQELIETIDEVERETRVLR